MAVRKRRINVNQVTIIHKIKILILEKPQYSLSVVVLAMQHLNGQPTKIKDLEIKEQFKSNIKGLWK